MNEIRYASGFSGIGGFDLALDRLGFKRVWSCDWDQKANQIYYKRFKPKKGEHYSGDIRRVNPKNLPDFDLFCAGFPCPSYSVAGRREGFKDQRGEVFFEIPRIAKVKRPSLLLLENVKGLLNHDRGRTFTIILQSLDELGYWLEWQVLNSKHFGVPQNRERVFIIGHLRGAGGREIFPITESSEITNVRDTEEQVALSLQSPGHASGNYRGMNMLAIPVLTPDRLKNRQHGRRFKEDGDPAFTLTEQDKHGVMVSNTIDQDGYLRRGARDRDENGKTIPTSITSRRIRRFTPVECERLQGFPDRWTEGITDTNRYRVLGKAVTVNVIEFIGKRILAEFTNNTNREE